MGFRQMAAPIKTPIDENPCSREFPEQASDFSEAAN